LRGVGSLWHLGDNLAELILVRSLLLSLLRLIVWLNLVRSPPGRVRLLTVDLFRLDLLTRAYLGLVASLGVLVWIIAVI